MARIAKQKIFRKAGVLLGMALSLLYVFSAAGSEFPYREKYPDVTPISTQDLFEAYSRDAALLVDVRSKIEFDVIHPEGTIHIPISNITFEKNVKELAARHPAKKIVFYCNGITCLKSYEAAEKALAAGLNSVFAYDAGIPEWAAVFPEKTLLLGKPLVNPAKQLIPKSEFQQRTLPFDDFKTRAAGPDAMVIDVRDGIQRSEAVPGLEKAMKIPLDKFIPNFVEKKEHQDRFLLIFDQVGKQVRWLEYYLVENGYQQYAFLKGGATAVLKTQSYK